METLLRGDEEMEGREREGPRSKRLSGLQEEVRRLRLEVGALRSTIDWAREAIEEFDQVPPGQDKYQEMRLIRFLGHMEARIGSADKNVRHALEVGYVTDYRKAKPQE